MSGDGRRERKTEIDRWCHGRTLTLIMCAFRRDRPIGQLLGNYKVDPLKLKPWLMLVLAVKPRFKVLPLNTTAYEGYPVMLHCVAIGEPTPKIQWDKNSFSHIDQRRFKVRTVMLFTWPQQIQKLKTVIKTMEPGKFPRVIICRNMSSAIRLAASSPSTIAHHLSAMFSIYRENTFPIFLPLSQS